MDVDHHPSSTRLGATPVSGPFWSWDLVEKVVLTSLITIIFAQVLPGTDSTPLQITFAVAIVVIASGAVSQWLASRGHTWESIVREFVAMTVVNVGIVIGYIVFLRQSDREVNAGATIFFILLLTLVITLFDRYRSIRAARFDGGSPGAVTG